MEVVCVKCGNKTKKSILTHNPTCRDCKNKNIKEYNLKNKERFNQLKRDKRKLDKNYGR